MRSQHQQKDRVSVKMGLDLPGDLASHVTLTLTKLREDHALALGVEMNREGGDEKQHPNGKNGHDDISFHRMEIETGNGFSAKS